MFMVFDSLDKKYLKYFDILSRNILSLFKIREES